MSDPIDEEISKDRAKNVENDDIVGVRDPYDVKSGDIPATPQARVIALHHDRLRQALPKVLAQGRGKWAEEILRIAFAEGIKVREDRELVEMLGALDADSPIPPEALMAVAEILAYVYRDDGEDVDQGRLVQEAMAELEENEKKDQK